MICIICKRWSPPCPETGYDADCVCPDPICQAQAEDAFTDHDPHCTCPDCLSDFIDQQEAAIEEAEEAERSSGHDDSEYYADWDAEDFANLDADWAIDGLHEGDE